LTCWTYYQTTLGKERPAVDDPRQRRDQLEKELQRASEALGEEVRFLSSGWAGRLGPFTISARISGEIITATYVLFNMICFAAGIGFIFLRGVFQALGISLIVGSLFSFGTFMAQWWDHAWQKQKDVLDHAYGDKRYVELRRLVKECDELYDKLDSSPEPPSQDDIS
jgi:hypothetical protein